MATPDLRAGPLSLPPTPPEIPLVAVQMAETATVQTATVQAATVQAATVQARAATVSALSQLVGKGLHLLLNVVSTLAILRYLAPEAYGSYALVIMVSTLAGVIADFGLPKLAVRELARSGLSDQRDADEILGTVVGLRLALAVVAAGACQGVLALLDQPTLLHQAAAISSLMLIMDAVLGVVVVSFQVRLVQQYEAVIRVVAEAVETALVLILIAMGAQLLTLFWPPVVGLTIGAVLALVLARRRFRLRLRPTRRRVRGLVREALPLGPGLLISVLYLKLDSLIVARLRPTGDLGIYASAYQPIEYLFLATAVIINVLFPIIAREWGSGDHDRFTAVYRRGTELLIILTAFVPLVLVFVAPGVVRLAFGAAYAEAAAPLRLLAVALIGMTVNAWQSLVLLSVGLQRITLLYNAVALVVALVLCTVLVQRIGLIGAALSAAITGCAVAIASTAVLRRRLGFGLQGRRLALIALAVGATALVLTGLAALATPWPVIAAVATLGYATLILRFGFGRSIREAFA